VKTLLAYSLLVLVVAAVAVQAQAPAGGEFRVSNATASGDTRPRLSVDGRGEFVVTWVESSVTGTVRARRYDPLGVPRGGQFDVGTASFAVPSAVASDDRGRTLVVWRRYDNGSDNIAARGFDAPGAPVGGEFTVNQQQPAFAAGPVVAAARGGSFLVVWQSNLLSGGIRGRFVGLRGNAVTPEFRVSEATNGYQPSVATNQLGGFVVVWGSGGGSGDVFGRRFDGYGAPVGGDFRVNAYTTGRQFDPHVVSDHLGSFVVVWQDQSNTLRIAGRRFDASGSPQGEDFVVGAFSMATQHDVAAASDRAGNFTVVWENPDGSDRGVFARRFSAAGVPRGAQFRVNTVTTGLQGYPAVAADPAGNLFLAWASQQGGLFTEIYGQRFGGLLPSGLRVADGNNGVLEVDESFTLVPSWRNVTGAPQGFQGHVSGTFIPLDLTLTLTPDAGYGTVANGATAPCTACYLGSVTGVRPIGHVDAVVFEAIVPELQGQVKRWAVHVGDSFADVPRASLFYRYVETLFHHEVTSGCIGNQFCPASVTTREQMAPFLLVAREGARYSPPGCISSSFTDVAPSSIYCPFIEELRYRGIVSGCGDHLYCPTAAVTREQMAVFVLRTLDPALDPPACTTPMFADVPASSPFCRWIEELARRGVVSGCGNGRYCPADAVTREQMSVFLALTFGLTLYGA
jgi:hypothetical protein